MYAQTLITSILVDRPARQRTQLPGIEELADSISRLGLINPITISSSSVLVAGERRLEACKYLGWTHVPTFQVDDARTETDLYAIELEENIKRVDLPWQERVRAIEAYHKMRKAENPQWTQDDTAAAIGIERQTVGQQLAVAQEMHINPKVAEAPKYTVARGITERQAARRNDVEILRFQSILTPHTPTTPTEPTIQTADFVAWAPSYVGPRFNFVHCDFPYGINADGFAQGSAAAHGGYVDTEDTYWQLCKALADNLDTLTAPSAHFIFWFSMKFYRQTLDFFHTESDIVFDPFPLIWMKTDNAGILPDPSRGPRRIYETALYGRRGDRPVVQAVANAYGAPTVRHTHMSEKPEPMLRHFFRMVVDKTSTVLDPTCGSGSAIRAAEGLGAAHVRGLELNPEFAARAELELVKARKLREVVGV